MPDKVPNPRIAWLQQLKSQVESAVGGVPDISAPTGAIGGKAWKGTRADRVHETLAGMAPTIKSALNGLADDVQDAIDAVQPKEVTAEEARFLHNDHAHNPSAY